MNAEYIAREQLKASGASLDRLFVDQEASEALNKTFHQLSQLSACQISIANRRESRMLELAIKEFQFAQYQMCLSLYRQSFASMRLAFELALGAVYFSAHEIKLRTWFDRNGDVVWSELMDLEKGVFGKSFVEAFCPDLLEHCCAYRTIATKVYRECSEYVHGNAETHTYLPDKITFSKDITLAWCAKVDTFSTVFFFCFVTRYIDELTESTLESLKPTFLEFLQHIGPIRARLGGAKEN
jgi:hypothetical protein